MQKIKKYISHFATNKVYDQSWIEQYIDSFDNLHKTLFHNLPIEDFDFDYLEWSTPYFKPIRDDYYNILYNMASYCKVKVMWRNRVEQDGELNRVLWIIGSKTRIKIFDIMITKWYNGIYNVEQKLKTNKTDFENLTGNIKEELIRFEDMIISVLRINTKIDYGYILRLETYVMGRFKLDYKKYHTDHKEYAHAISKRFHHRRMVL